MKKIAWLVSILAVLTAVFLTCREVFSPPPLVVETEPKARQSISPGKSKPLPAAESDLGPRIQQLTATGAANLLLEIASLPDRGGRAELLAHLFERWAAVDEDGMFNTLYHELGFPKCAAYGKELAEFAARHPELEKARDLLRLGVAGWTYRDPALAYLWADRQNDPALRDSAMEQVALVAGESGVSLSRDAYDRIGDERIRSDNGPRLAMSLARNDPASHADWIDGFSKRIDKPGARALWETFYITWSRLDPVAAMARISQAADQFPRMKFGGNDLAMSALDGELAFPTTWLEALPAGEFKVAMVRDFAKVYSTQDPVRTWEALQASPQTFGAAGVAAVLESWAVRDAVKATEIYNQWSGDHSEAALKGLMSGRVRSDPLGTLKWISQEPDASLRGVLREAAARALSENSALDPWSYISQIATTEERKELGSLLVLKEIEAGTDKSAIAKRIQDSPLLREDKALLNRQLMPR
ncbi:MAG: hypothetical protein V4819_01900 [Verrucomicrobiota bacterium]